MSAWVGRSGLFHVGAAASVRSLVLEARAAGSTVYVLPPVDSKAGLLAALGEHLRFPSWAGHNWDAAADLLSDLSWLPHDPITLVWAEPESLDDTDPGAYRTAVEVLTYAARTNSSHVLTVLLAHRGPYSP